MFLKLIKPATYGILASIILLGIYFTILSLVSGWNFAQDQFNSYWYFILSLSAGFGIQIGLYSYLKNLIRNSDNGGRVLGVTGTTSTVAMISCCSHYLVNILPILGIAGVITVLAQYQIELFWIGLFFNLAGIIYLSSKILSIKRVQQAKKNIKKNLHIIIGILGVIVIAVLIKTNQPDNKNNDLINKIGEEMDSSLDIQVSKEGPVTITVRPISLSDVSFEIILNTHSVEITEDLTALSVLINEKGAEYKPTVWNGDPVGGHHRSGILHFGKIIPSPQTATLIIRRVGGIAERRFEWSLTKN